MLSASTQNSLSILHLELPSSLVGPLLPVLHFSFLIVLCDVKSLHQTEDVRAVLAANARIHVGS